MSIAYQCDGCAVAIPDNPAEIGTVLKRHYCPECTTKAQAFLDAEAAARVALHAAFSDKRAALIAEFGAGGFKLPDVINAG